MLRIHKSAQLCVITNHLTSCDWYKCVDVTSCDWCKCNGGPCGNAFALIITRYVASCGTKCAFFCVIGVSVMMGHVGTHLHQLQLVMWRVVTQSCAFFCVLPITLKFGILGLGQDFRKKCRCGCKRAAQVPHY